MFLFKIVLALSGLLCIYGASVLPPAENIVQCLESESYTVLVNETLHEDASENDGMVDLVINFPGQDKTNDATIACVKLTNLNPGDGAEVKVMTGGILSKRVIAIIGSGFGKPLDYQVEILSE